MTKNEFEALIMDEVSDSEYETIEYVYTWHPAIDEVKSKAQIARLYTDYGMTVIKDMLPRTRSMEALDRQLREAQKVVADIQKQIDELRR